MSDPIKSALAAKDDCELGRIMREQHGELLARLAVPAPPDRDELLDEDGKPLDYASLSHGF